MTIAASAGPPQAAPGAASPLDDGTPWEELAACRGADPELFFPVSSTGPSLVQIREAKAICAACPVRQPCLAYALDTRQEFGIWGGLDEQERRRAARSRPAPARR
jgi:WhiB family transcriptional regulator, redox-sensing transcriptional regulator